ncbi:MAG: monofunctional biosynthetic peptidoglycan transglycosylase [Bacteroidota bacterium]
MGKRSRKKARGARRVVGGLFAFLLALPVTYLGVCSMWLVLYLVVPPPITGVQIQRLIEARFEEEPMRHAYRPVRGENIPLELRRAVVAAEDARFYQHRGIDVDAVRIAVEEGRRRGGGIRGASTITQQLVKNLFMTTHRSWVRKAMEVPLALVAEIVLPKERILTLYLTVVEWDRGVYGAEAAARHHYGISASDLTRHQAASLAACLPNPRERRPQQMGWYTTIILRRMSQMGW